MQVIVAPLSHIHTPPSSNMPSKHYWYIIQHAAGRPATLQVTVELLTTADAW